MLLELRAEAYANGHWTYLSPPKQFLEGEIARYLSHIPFYPDWFHNCGFKNCDVRAVLSNGGNYDHFSPIRPHWQIPTHCSKEIHEIVDNSIDIPSWILYSDLLAYDWSKVVCKYARIIPADQARLQGLTPNQPDGSCRVLQSHQRRDWLSRGYAEVELTTKECVPELFIVLERIRASAPTGTEPHLIRLYIWDV